MFTKDVYLLTLIIFVSPTVLASEQLRPLREMARSHMQSRIAELQVAVGIEEFHAELHGASSP